MLEQFSDPARRVVTLAEEEADRLGHPHIGTEHLLLGLLGEAGTGAAAMLSTAGATLVAARGKVIEAVGPSAAPGPGPLIRTARAQRALDRAVRFSRGRGEQWVQPDDVLAGVLDVEGRAGQVLRGLGVDVTALGAAVKRSQHPPPPAPPPAAASRGSSRRSGTAPQAAGPAGPRCPHCGTDLAGGVSHRRVPSRGDPEAVTAFVVAFCPVCGAAFGAAPSEPPAP